MSTREENVLKAIFDTSKMIGSTSPDPVTGASPIEVELAGDHDEGLTLAQDDEVLVIGGRQQAEELITLLQTYLKRFS